MAGAVPSLVFKIEAMFLRNLIVAKLLVATLGVTAQVNYVDYVNPLMGTLSKHSLSNGNTYPAIGMPWGMNLWTPQTNKMGDGWVYQYTADKIVGFKQTHQPSPWMNDYGFFSVMPVRGKMRFREEERANWFSHKTEVARPHYYKVYLADDDITVELSPTERAAMFRFTFPESDSAWVVLDAADRGSYTRIIPGENKIVGYTTRNSGGVHESFRNYFVITFNRKFDMQRSWTDGNFQEGLEASANHTGAVIGFKGLKKGEQVIARVASSFISAEQAELNLRQELGNTGFDALVEQGRKEWNEVLGRVRVSGGTEEQMRTFYSCLYRMVFFPLKMYEKNAAGKIVHYSPYSGKTEDGYMFAGTGFWDTFRALYPFLNLVYPGMVKEMQEGLINDYEEGGWLPEWSSPGYRDIMVGNNSASVVAESWLKGVRGYDIEKLYQALVKGANNEGPITAVGRKGVGYYNELGYVPYNVGINENAARTLEYAYDDYAIYALGKALGKPKAETALYKKRSLNYTKLFDKEHLLMRGRNKEGEFQRPFNPLKWGDAFTEGNSWHYSWSVFHDVEGLKQLMGGNAPFVRMLDSVFKMPPVFDESYYGAVIHEIREMQIMNMGQYAHGNQPIQHMTYLYNYAGQPWKSQERVREVMDKLYHSGADGYCGDEDNGQTSAWYVFSALGFYPVTPAHPQYVVGAPLFRRAEILLENGKKLVVQAPQNSAKNKYIQQLTLNGKPYTKNYLDHSELLKGATLQVTMGAKPNQQRGTKISDYPFSMSLHDKD